MPCKPCGSRSGSTAPASSNWPAGGPTRTFTSPAALNISPAQVRSALSRNNYLSAVGSTKGSLLQVNLTANTDLHTAEDFKKLVVRQDKGTLVRLGDIADVVLGAEDYNAEVRFSGQKAVFMGIYVLPNANSVDVIRRVRTEMDQIKRQMPDIFSFARKI